MATGRNKPDANLRGWLVFCCVILVVSGTAASATLLATVALPAGYNQYSLNAYASYLIDSKGEQTPEQINRETRWQRNVAGDVLNFGFTDAVVWVKLDLDIPSEKTDEWHLVLPYPLLEQVNLFVVSNADGTLQEQIPDNAKLRSHYLHFALPPSNGTPLLLLLRVQSFTSLQVPLELWSQSELVNHQSTEATIWGVYFGVLLALLAYNAFLFLSMRDIAYCCYVIYLCSIVLLMLCISGMGSLYVWEDPQQLRVLLPLSTGMTSLWAILFALAFLRTTVIHPRLKLALWICAGLSALLILQSFGGSGSGALMSGLLSIVVVAIVIVAGINALASGAVIARYFILAWAAFAMGAMVYLLNIFNLVPVSGFTTHAIQVGSALEAILLSFALAHRIKEERQLKLSALEDKNRAEQQMKQAQSLALEQALHDGLTQRPNDALLLQRVQDLIRRSGQIDAFALMLFYCPQLKEISSSLGRRLAEEVFCSIVEDTNRLMAGDPQNIPIETSTQSFVAVTEFGSMVALCRLDAAAESIYAYAQRYMAFYDRTIDVDGVLLDLDVVCGVACYPKQSDRADLLLQHAAAARDFGLRISESVTIYSSEIEAFGRRRLLLIGALTQAIRDGELELYLQPQVHCQSLQLVGAEALLRWNSPRLGVVSPQEFVEVAEQAGLMGLLSRYVIDKAFGLLVRFAAERWSISLSINLSIQNLVDPGMVSYVQQAAAQAGISLHDVVFEVTETFVTEDMDVVVANVRELAATGCSIALDDYGTGYSSLAYLSRLPIHELKIDRSFVGQMNRNESDLRIVENTLKLARALQIETVAEGVEDAATLDSITRLGCDRVQGYHIARPMPFDAFREWVLRRRIQLLESPSTH